MQTHSALDQAKKELDSLGAPPLEDRNINKECRTIVKVRI